MTDSIILTKKIIDSTPLPTKGRTVLHDAKVPGLVVRVTPAGSKSFLIYRWHDGKPLRVTLGKYPAMTIEQARRAAQQTLAQLSTGTNPNKEKRVAKAKAVTVSEVFAEFQNTRALKPLTVKDMTQSMNQVFADWLDKPIASITRDMVTKRHRDFGEQSQARANLGFRYFRALWNFAHAAYKDDAGNSFIPGENPVKALSELRAWHRVERRQTFIKPHQLKAWYGAIQELPGRDWADYFLFTLFCGTRRQEGLDLCWTHVDFKDKTFTIVDPKNHRDHTLPMSTEVEAILRRRKTESDGRSPECRSCHVFADANGSRITNPRYALAAVIKTSGVDFSPHDLRRTFATICDQIDLPAYALKSLLNHKNGNDVTAGYVVVTVDRLRKPMQSVCDFIMKQVEGTEDDKAFNG